MRFYLRVANPVVSIIVLALCVYASVHQKEGGGLDLRGALSDPLLTYFLAKGLFCSSTLFILGHLLLHLIEGPRRPPDERGAA